MSRSLRIWRHTLLVTIVATLLAATAQANTDEGEVGLWSMYFWNTNFGNGAFGAQGDIQYRQWDVGEDLEQLLIRGGLTWRPAAMQNTLLTLGYANITSGTFGPSNSKSRENRAYQEALLSQQPADWLYLRHRFRFEQRWVEDQDFRMRFRYALFADVPLNGVKPGPGSMYLALYNEIFINAERDIGDGGRVEVFDRNRAYAALGYGLQNGMRLQAGYMYQETNALGKGQLQVSLHHSF